MEPPRQSETRPRPAGVGAHAGVTAQEFAALLTGRARRRGATGWWDSQCPAHDDQRASLSFRNGDRGLIVRCHAGCAIAAIAAAIHLGVSDLFYANGNGGARHIVATYEYPDAAGALLYQAVRYEPKDFRCRRPDGAGGWDQSNLEANPVRVIRDVLGVQPRHGPIDWPSRRDPLLAMLAKNNPHTGRAALQLDPEDAIPADRALSGRWHYPLVRGQVSREAPVKNHPWSDIADSLTYLIAGVAPTRLLTRREKPKVVGAGWATRAWS
jgi:hypothetical protein